MARTEVGWQALAALVFAMALACAPGAFGTDQAVALQDYMTNQTLIPSRGFWYDITTWAARTHNCDTRPESVACMACCMNLPKFGWESGVAPLGVGNWLWFNPSRGATCGMCMRVYMPAGINCTSSSADSNPACAGTGTKSYDPNVAQKWAYGARIYYDESEKLHFFIGMVVEWFDRNQSLPTAITYPTQGINTDTFGTWPILWRAVPCPVGNHKLLFQFLNVSAPHPVTPTNQSAWVTSGASVGTLPEGVTSSLCDNEFSKPCAEIAPSNSSRAPLQFIKLMIAGSRIPVTGASLKINGTWHSLHRSGDNYWQPDSSDPAFQGPQDPWAPLSIRVWCGSDQGSYQDQNNLVPGNCMCSYQDPDCQPCEGSIQC